MELTKRLIKLKDRLFNEEFQDPGIWHFKNTNILNDDNRDEPLIVRKAMAMEYMCQHLPAYIKRDELIVGNPNQTSVGWGTVLPTYFTEEERDEAARHELNECSVWGHHPPKWDMVINVGIKGIRAEIEAAIEREVNAVQTDQTNLDLYRAMIIAVNGVVQFAQRHAAAALREAMRCEDPIRRAELLEIHHICSHVPENPARTLQEATQAYWFIYCIVNSGGEYVPLARGDQFLYPFYAEDLKTNRITKEKAVDIVGSFLVKCNERIIIDTKRAENHSNFGMFSQGRIPDEAAPKSQTGGYDSRALTWQEDEDINSEANFNYGQSGNDWLMNFIVGGQDAEGHDATNALSYLILDLVHDMHLVMPTLGARVHNSTPEAFWDKLAEVLRYGQGEPMVYNDETIIPGFVDQGVPVEDARDYTNDGCWETLIPGKSHFSYAHVENLTCLEWVLFRGVSQKTGLKEGLDTGDPTAFADFEELYAAYQKQMFERVDFHCKRRMENLGLSFMIAPDPLMSAITDDCITRGRDLSQDGAKYIFHLILATGLANTVDALAVVKKLVFEDQSVSMAQLIEALAANWEGHELLRLRAIKKAPKFGNDDDYVDKIASRLMKDLENRVDHWRRHQDMIKFPVGVGTFENYAALGRPIWASADGRYTSDALASNYSPQPGYDVEGPTAIFKSITKPDLLKYYCGCPVDISLNSNEFEGELGIDRLKSLIKSFCDLGGQILTVTSTTVEDLKDAKVNPEQHQGLRVRMGGLSAYFIAMAPVQQDNIIKRFEKGVV